MRAGEFSNTMMLQHTQQQSASSWARPASTGIVSSRRQRVAVRPHAARSSSAPCCCEPEQQAGSSLLGSGAAAALAAGVIGLSAMTTPALAAGGVGMGVAQQGQSLEAALVAGSALSASPLAAEAPALVSNSGEVLLEGFKGIVEESLHDLTDSSMTAVGGPVTGDVLSSGGAASNGEADGSSSSSSSSSSAPSGLAAELAAPQAASSSGPSIVPQRPGLLCSMWQAYCDALETSPLLTKVYTGILGTLLGDLAAQVLSHQQQQQQAAASARGRSSSGGGAGGCHTGGFRFNVLRAGRLCLYSALIGTPMGALEYQWLEAHVMPGSPSAPAAVAAKVCLDQLVQTPFGMALFLAVMRALEGHWRPAELRHELQAKMVPALLANYKLWPAAQLLNFTLVPQEQRILYGNVVGIVWTIIISNMQQASSEAPAAPEPVAGDAGAVDAAPARAASTMPA